MRNTLIKAIKKASKIANDNFGKSRVIKAKKGISLVTDVDMKCNEAIIKAIKEKFSSHNIYSEETGFENNNNEYTWYIDPIDGTHNFSRKIPIYGISVALARNNAKSNNVILGAVSLPSFKDLYFAETGKGACLNNKKISVSKKKKLNFYMVGFDFPSTRRQYSLSFLDNISAHVVDTRQFGCAVYQAMLLAEGKIDAYVIQKTNPWDIAASFLIIEEAQGKVTNFEGRKWSLKDERFVATNGLIHNKILGCVKHLNK